MHFTHDGIIVIIDQISFVCLDHCMTANHLNSLNVPYIQVVSPTPEVNYVALSPIPSISNENEPLDACSSYLDLVLVVDIRTPSLGPSNHVLLLVYQSEALDMYSF